MKDEAVSTHALRGPPVLLLICVRRSMQVTCRKSGAAMTLTRSIALSAGPAEGSAIASGSAERVAAGAAWRRTEPSAQPVASRRLLPNESHDSAVTQEACAMKDPTCTAP